MASRGLREAQYVHLDQEISFLRWQQLRYSLFDCWTEKKRRVNVTTRCLILCAFDLAVVYLLAASHRNRALTTGRRDWEVTKKYAYSFYLRKGLKIG